ncbi:hypothetical protein LZ31DRAFT_548593 [Colletotrichum somersetense]|nr:hypothetical protein LZ31DRAFT_548593 [Colletotrichum somersetense]
MWDIGRDKPIVFGFGWDIIAMSVGFQVARATFGDLTPTPSPTQQLRALKVDLLVVTTTCDHTHWRTRDPVRSPIDKPVRAGVVVGSVTTGECPVLHVFGVLFFGCPL